MMARRQVNALWMLEVVSEPGHLVSGRRVEVLQAQPPRAGAARVSRVSIGPMDLPPGPRAPAVWQTLAWMTRPGAFLRRVHARFGDPATIRTYWTEEPMVLFSSPDSVRAVFRLDPAIAPAGQSWEFLRPFAGPHSILLLDGEEHIRERRLLQGPFHGERMRAFAPMIGELARRELASWNGRVVALDRMRELTLDIILRVVFGARDEELVHVRGVIEESLATVRSLPWVLAMAVVRKDLGPRSPWGRFRVAVERFDAELYAAPRAPAHGGARGLDAGAAARGARRARQPARAISTSATSWSRCSWAGMTAPRPRWRGGSSSWPAIRTVQARLREGDPAYLDAVVKEVLRARPALTIAPRLLLEPASIAGRIVPGRGPGRRLPLARLPAPGPVGRSRSSSGPTAGSKARRRIRCRGFRSVAGCAVVPALRSRRWRCGRCCARLPT